MSAIGIFRQPACHTRWMATAAYHQWLDAVFDHPVHEQEWYWDEGFDTYWADLELTDAATVEYMTRLFSAPDRLKQYSPEQVAQGLWFLIGESAPGQSAYALLNRGVALNDRIKCVGAMLNFFCVFVAPAAPGRATEQTDDFQQACYMWWDIFPTYGGARYGPETGGEPELHTACLNVMEAMLSVPSELCQLTALHGLNHWHQNYSKQVERIVDSFLNKTPNLTNRIIEYAGRARAGGAL
jgi:hypothetical protein